MSLHTADQWARTRALEATTSFCVLAPAGSGKTELLTQRLLKLLSLCEQPEQILAITFTRKAAGEMRHRLLQNLGAAQAGTPLHPDSDHARMTRTLALAVLRRNDELQWQLLEQPARLRIVTIDSFTGYLTARLPLAAGFGARPELSTDMDATFRQAVRNTLALLNGNDSRADAIATLLLHLHNNLQQAEELLLTLLHSRADWLPQLQPLASDPDRFRPFLEHCMQAVLLEQLQRTRAQVLPFESALMELVAFAHSYRAAAGDNTLAILDHSPVLPAASIEAATQWQALANFLLTESGGFRKALNRKLGFIAKTDCKDKEEQARVQRAKDSFKTLCDDMSTAGTLPHWQALLCLPPAHYRNESWPVLAALLNVLPLLTAQLRVAMQGAGLIDHVETSIAALHALGSDEQPTDLALQLDYRLQHILVDEFQDTSWTQFALLEKLTAAWQDGDGRTLFIVGDGMQSCYGFRNADVSLFLRARDEGIGAVRLEPLQLTANFRSDATVVNWVNQAFSQAFPASDDLLRGGVRYTASSASKPSSTGAGVECVLQVIDSATNDDEQDDAAKPDAKDLRYQSRLQEATQVAARCATLRQQHPQDSIAILVRNRSHLAQVLPALRRQGLHWTATEIDPLLAYQDIADLHTLLRALLNTADITALLALLHSPLIGLSLHALDQLALHANQQALGLWQLLAEHSTLKLGGDDQTRLARAVPVLLRTRALRQHRALRELLELCWLELGGASTVQDAAVLPNVVLYLDLVEQHSSFDDIPDIHAFELALGRCFGSAAVDPGLHVMTIHKAKGLEFDHVLLCGLDQRPRNDDAPLLRWQHLAQAHGPARLLLALKQQRGGEEEPLYTWLGEEQDQRNRYELTRLLYIGVTRAIKTARLYGTVTRDKKGEFKVARKSLLATLMPHLTDNAQSLGVSQIPVLPSALAPTASAPASTHQPVLRLPAAWHSPLPASLLPVPARDNTDAVETADNLLARRMGELVHLGLKQLVQAGETWLLTSSELPFWRAQLAPLCSAAELNQQMQVLQLHLQSCQRSEQGRWLFLVPHAEDVCELGLQDYRSGLRRYYVVDRSFVDENGERWIVDYKTATPAAGQGVEDFLAEQAARYLPQLKTYQALMAELDPATARRCRLALYFTALDRLHELLS